MKKKKTFREIFNEFSGEYKSFSLVENNLSNCADIHAFLLLEPCRYPNDSDSLLYVVSDERRVYLRVDITVMERSLSEDQMRDLVRCGVIMAQDREVLYLIL